MRLRITKTTFNRPSEAYFEQWEKLLVAMRRALKSGNPDRYQKAARALVQHENNFGK